MKNPLIIPSAILLLVSCSHSAKWSVDGNIEGASEGSVIVEASNSGFWYPIDTLKVANNGDFKGQFTAAEYPNIYRFTYDGRSIYIPVDSIETIHVTASSKAFDTQYTISGSEAADAIMALDKKINSFVKSTGGAAALDTAINLKRSLATDIANDYSSLAAYYLINKSVDGHKLYRPEVAKELAVIGAVANAFNEHRPNDPRTAYIAQLFVSNRNQGKGRTIEAQESGLIDINLLDENGKNQSLRDVAEKNKVVILNFTAYDTDFSQALNIALHDLYKQYHSAGLEIYQIGFDNSEVEWRLSARNQPWVTVYNGGVPTHLQNYNVGDVPALFVISNGVLAERILKIENLKSSVAKRF